MYKNIIEKHKSKLSFRRKSIDTILFSHIPKTAGTSFRKSFEKNTLVMRDYGLDSPETSEVIKKYIYELKEPYFLKMDPILNKVQWFCGHFPLAKYIDLVKVFNTISFVREPLEQVISHYNHHVLHQNYKGSLDEFINVKSWQNMQSKYLGMIPIGLVGCVGVTERFKDSLQIINKQFGVDIEEETHNVNPNKHISLDNLDDEIAAKIEQYNHLDKMLYEEANFILTQRLLHFEQSLPWVFSALDKHVNNTIHGCAFYANNNYVVELLILKNSKPMEEIKANQYFSKYTKANLPRKRYIGFYFSLPKNALESDYFDIIVKSTKQKLNFHPFTIESK